LKSDCTVGTGKFLSGSEAVTGIFVIDKRASAARLLDAQMKQNSVQRTGQMSKVLLRVGIHFVSLFGFIDNEPTQRVHAIITSLTEIKEAAAALRVDVVRAAQAVIGNVCDM
jgi:hypothetical protein